MSDTAIDSALAPVAGIDFNALAAKAIEKGSVEQLERLVALQERILDRNARTEFASALAEFQGACPSIPKSSLAEVKKDGRVIASYRYAELDAIARVVNPLLARLGLSYTFDNKITAGSETAPAMLACLCTVRHANGHSTTAEFVCPIGGTNLMSEPQKAAATLTFAKRQALVQALGLSMTEDDTDARPTDVGGNDTPAASPDQVANIQALLDEIGTDKDGRRLCARLGVARLTDIPSNEVARVIRFLEEKRAGRA